MIPVALSALREHASIFFENKKTVEHLSLALEEAIGNVIFFSGSEDLEEITLIAGTEDGSYCVDLMDKGLPGDFSLTLDGENAIGLAIMRKCADSVSIDNLGLGGRRQRIVKYLSSVPEDILSEASEELSPIDGSSLTFRIRPVQESDLLEVSRGIYREYGLTYLHDYAYLPEVYMEHINSGKYRSIVAVTEDGMFGGHHAFWEWSDYPGVFESGIAVVNPRLRNCGIFNMLMTNTTNYYLNTVKRGAYVAYCIATHPFSQRARLKTGSTPCAFAFNYIPPKEIVGKTMPDVPTSSFALFFTTTDKSRKKVWLPEEITETAGFIYDMHGLPREFCTQPEAIPDETSVVKSDYVPRICSGRISFLGIGKDYYDTLRSNVFNIRRQDAAMCELFFPANTPASIPLYEEAKKEGFFFTGIIPNSDVGDLIIMNRIFKGVIDYSVIHTIPEVEDLLEKIKKFDPDLQK